MNGTLRTPGYQRVLEDAGFLVVGREHHRVFKYDLELVATYSVCHVTGEYLIGSVIGGAQGVVTFVEFVDELLGRGADGLVQS